ncbi:MAG: pilus assembly protein [Caldilineaceae bacterium]
MNTIPSPKKRSELGQSIVEFAIVVPFVVLLTLGVVDLGRVIFLNTMFSAAVQEGAREGAVTANFTRIQQAVEGELVGVAPGDVVISIERTEVYTEVGITYVFVPVTPMLSTIVGTDGLLLERAARMQLLGVFP